MLKNFILETANAPGTTTTVNLAGPATGRLAFSQGFTTGAAVYYFMDDGAQAEWGNGIFTSGAPNTVTRATVIGNTAGNTSRLNFTGSVRVYNEVPAERLPYQGTNGAVNLSGTTAGDDAPAGYVGEYLAATAGPTLIASVTPKTITSISLTAGDWDVWGTASFQADGATTFTSLQAGLSTTTDAFTGAIPCAVLQLAFPTGSGQAMAVPQGRLTLGAPATAYLVVQGNFAVANMRATAFIYARRRR